MRRVVATIVAAIGLMAMTATTAFGDVYDDNPSAASRGPGDLFLFARANDGALLERHLAGGAWTDWASLGFEAASGPAAVYYGGALQVFVRGTDGAVWQNALVNGAWGDWISLGGTASSAPAVTVRRGPLNYLDLAVRGTDNAIHLRTYVPGSGWSPWGSLGGNLTSAPALNSQGDGILNVFARGTDGSVFQKSWDGAQWIEWFTLGGSIVGAPTAISREPGLLNLYVQGLGGVSHYRSWGAGGWSAWSVLDPAPVQSTPAPMSDDPGREAVAARRGGNLVLKTWLAASGWGGWADLGPVAVPPPPAAPAPPPGDGEVQLEAGLKCTPPGGKLRVHITIRKQPGQAKARVQRIVFYTKGKGRKVRVDRKAPFVVRMTLNRPAASKGRVYARVYYRRNARGKLQRKTVSRRYVMCGQR